MTEKQKQHNPGDLLWIFHLGEEVICLYIERDVPFVMDAGEGEKYRYEMSYVLVDEQKVRVFDFQLFETKQGCQERVYTATYIQQRPTAAALSHARLNSSTVIQSLSSDRLNTKEISDD